MREWVWLPSCGFACGVASGAGRAESGTGRGTWCGVPEWLPGRGAWSWDLCCGSPSWLPCPGSSVPLCSGLTLALNTSLSSSNLALVCSGTPSVLILLASRAVTNTAFPGSKGCAESPGTSANRAALCHDVFRFPLPWTPGANAAVADVIASSLVTCAQSCGSSRTSSWEPSWLSAWRPCAATPSSGAVVPRKRWETSLVTWGVRNRGIPWHVRVASCLACTRGRRAWGLRVDARRGRRPDFPVTINP